MVKQWSCSEHKFRQQKESSEENDDDSPELLQRSILQQKVHRWFAAITIMGFTETLVKRVVLALGDDYTEPADNKELI